MEKVLNQKDASSKMKLTQDWLFMGGDSAGIFVGGVMANGSTRLFGGR